MFISDPGSIFIHPKSRIPDPTTATKEQPKQFCCLTFFVATNTVWQNWQIFILEQVKKNLNQFTENRRTFYPQKLSLSSQKYGSGIRVPGSPGSKIRDPGSGKTYFGSQILDPGVKQALSCRSFSRLHIICWIPFCTVGEDGVHNVFLPSII